MIFWIDVESSGSKVGDGPIITATEWENQDVLDRAGTFNFSMPANDPKAALLVSKRVARCYALVNGAITQIGAGIIDKLSLRAEPDGLMLDVSGNNQLRELTYRQVGNLAIGTSSVPVTTSPQSIIAYAPAGWSLDTTGGYNVTAKSVYHQFEGETVLEGFVKLVDLTGEHFRLSAGPKVTWLQNDAASSGIIAVENGDPVAIEDTDAVCLIKSITEEQDSYDLATRIYPYGAGEGAARVTLAASTWAAPAGYTISTGSNCIINTTSEATYGQIDLYMSFKDCNNANMLAEQAYEHLKRISSVNKFYNIELDKLDTVLLPGQTLKVIANRWIDGYNALSINDDLNILEVTNRLDQGGYRTVGVRASTIDRHPASDASLFINSMNNSRAYAAHTQPLSGGDITGTISGVVLGSHTHATSDITGFDAATRDALFQYLVLPNLRGLWPMSSVDSSGSAMDISGQGRHLANNGTCTFPVYGDVVPYLETSGSSQYLSRADEVGLSITGAFTVGCWFLADTIGATFGLVTKWLSSGNQRSYQLILNNSERVYAYVSGDGTASVNKNATATISAGTWHFAAMRYTPSSELAVFLDGVKATNVTSIPASCYDSTATFDLGAVGAGSSLLDGRIALPFVCAAAVSDMQLTALYERSRVLFGV